MTENQKKYYKLILKIALTYRLSLDNICLLIGKEITKENKDALKNIFYIISNEIYTYKRSSIILFDYETINESKIDSNSSFKMALNFYNRYMEANRNKDKEAINELIDELNELDLKIKQIRTRDKAVKLTQDDYDAICRYRIKYSISQKEISECLDIRRETLRAYESRIENSKLQKKLNILNDYYMDVSRKSLKTIK